MDEKLWSAIIGAGVVVLGWIVTDFLARRRGEESKRKEIAIGYIESQIKELYGPLLGLIEYSEDVYNVAKSLLPGPMNDKRKDFPPKFSPEEIKTWGFFVESYFIQIHMKIRELLAAKTHLLVGIDLPACIHNFLNYAAHLECRHNLYLKYGIDTSRFPGAEYPPELKTVINNMLISLHNRQRQLLREQT
jgi:hypothetical protein